MDAQHLRHRITPEFKKVRASYAQIDEEEERLWEQGLPLIQHHDDLDERHLAQGQSVRSAHNAQKRGVERLFRLMVDALVQSCFPTLPQEQQKNAAASLYETGWERAITEYFRKREPKAPERVVRIAQNRKDVKDNFLYEEWLRQSRKPDGIKTYAVYALQTGLKSAFVLMTSKPGSDELIRSFYQGHLPDREGLLKIGELMDITSMSQEEVMGALISFPYMLDMAEALIIHYADFVRSERVDKSDGPVLHSPLPDDPLEKTLPDRYDIPEDVRFKNGLQAYLAKEGNYRTIAKKYNLPEKRFLRYLQDEGVIQPRGGDRKV